MSVITFVCAGQMNSAITFPAFENGHEVRLVGSPLDRDIIDGLKKDNFHITLKRTLHDGIKYYQIEELEEALKGADLVLGGVSSFGLDWFCDEILPVLPEDVPVLTVTKGMVDLEDGTLVPYPHIFAQRQPEGKHLNLNAIGGPCTSYELADHDDSHVAFCGKDVKTLKYIKSLLETDYYSYFSFYRCCWCRVCSCNEKCLCFRCKSCGRSCRKERWKDWKSALQFSGSIIWTECKRNDEIA